MREIYDLHRSLAQYATEQQLGRAIECSKKNWDGIQADQKVLPGIPVEWGSLAMGPGLATILQVREVGLMVSYRL